MPVKLHPGNRCEEGGAESGVRSSRGRHHRLAVLLAERVGEARLEVLAEEVVEVRLATELEGMGVKVLSARCSVEDFCGQCRSSHLVDTPAESRKW